MANQPILPTNVAVVALASPAQQNPNLARKPILPPSGSQATGGPTTGQVFPVGNR